MAEEKRKIAILFLLLRNGKERDHKERRSVYFQLGEEQTISLANPIVHEKTTMQ